MAKGHGEDKKGAGDIHHFFDSAAKRHPVAMT